MHACYDMTNVLMLNTVETRQKPHVLYVSLQAKKSLVTVSMLFRTRDAQYLPAKMALFITSAISEFPCKNETGETWLAFHDLDPPWALVSSVV